MAVRHYVGLRGHKGDRQGQTPSPDLADLLVSHCVHEPSRGQSKQCRSHEFDYGQPWYIDAVLGDCCVSDNEAKCPVRNTTHDGDAFPSPPGLPCRHSRRLGDDPRNRRRTTRFKSVMIKIDNVTKVYNSDVTALRDVNFDVAKGEFVFLVGQSGSGKSTLLRLVNKQEVPERGSVWVAGQCINELPGHKVPRLRRNIGNIFQDYKLLLNKTVAENVAFALEVIGRPKHVIRTQVPMILDLVGLADKQDRFPHQLSGGEQQRVSIARAFVNRPLILLADEPTGNLDPATGEGIMRLLDRINKTGTTVMMATHDRSIVNAMRRRVIELDRGSIIRDQARGVYE